MGRISSRHFLWCLQKVDKTWSIMIWVRSWHRCATALMSSVLCSGRLWRHLGKSLYPSQRRRISKTEDVWTSPNDQQEGRNMYVVSQMWSVKEIRVKGLQSTLYNKWLMQPTHMQLNSNCISFTFTEDYVWRVFEVLSLFKGCLSSEYPERDIFHSKSLSRGTSSVLCGHAPFCMNPVVLTLLTPSHVQKGRHGVWFPSPLTYNPTKDHSWAFVALYIKALNSRESAV